jgi:thioredoxin-related protein
MRLIALFVLAFSSVANAQIDERPDPVRTYAEGLNVAKAERRPLLVFITQKVCPSCKPARLLLDEMRFEEELGNCVVASVDATTTEGRALMIGKKLTPQIVLFDLRTTGKDGTVEKHGIEKVERPMILKLISKLKNP